MFTVPRGEAEHLGSAQPVYRPDGGNGDGLRLLGSGELAAESVIQFSA